MAIKIKTLGFYYRPDNTVAPKWEQKITSWLSKNFASVSVTSKSPQVIIVLGGDGTILEVARKMRNGGPLILGLNLGHVGFLASIREPKHFLTGIEHFLEGRYRVVKKIMIEAEVVRHNQVIFHANAFNDMVVQHLMGMVELNIGINGANIQFIRGNGVLVATASGSTAYNLSAHGPIVVPDLQCMVITELLDHNVPTPSVVVKDNAKIEIEVVSFRQRGLLANTATGQAVDVILNVDGDTIFPLQAGDKIVLRRSTRLVRFVEFSDNHFFRSLQEKFSFK